jgi:uncharacterized protein (DUF58 family)
VRRSATPKLKTYVAVGAASLFAGFAAGVVELVVVAVPVLVTVVQCLVRTSGGSFNVELGVTPERGAEGDVLSATITVTSKDHSGEVDVGLILPPGIEVAEGSRAATLLVSPGGTIDHEVKLRARRWGAHRLGPVAIRALGPGRFVAFDGIAADPVMVRIYPAFERMSRGLRPEHTHLYTGDYVARSSGDGIEFAHVRPFVTGDPVRRVNWRVTTRRRELHVNLSHPERDADVVLFLDTFNDIDLPGGSTLDITVRGASAIAHYHLRHNDRVGLVSFGGMLRWLTASLGRTHDYRIADFFLDVNTTFSYAWKDIELLPKKTLPPSALVVAFSPLVDERALRAVTDIAARGFSMVVVNTLAEGLILATEGREGRLAHRVWTLQREMIRARLAGAGVPLITWSGEPGIEGLVGRLLRSPYMTVSRR